jgi:ankyrin repeat protein
MYRRRESFFNEPIIRDEFDLRDHSLLAIAAEEIGDDASYERILQQLYRPNRNIYQNLLFDTRVSTPLNRFIGLGYNQCAELLISSGMADINRSDFCRKLPLDVACTRGNMPIAKILIEAKANINRSDGNDKATPLMTAAENNHPTVIELLIKNKANINLQTYASFGRADRTALMYAAKETHPNCIQKLLEANADINKIDCDGNTAFEMISNWVIQSSEKTSLKDIFENNTLAKHKDVITSLLLLLKAGASSDKIKKPEQLKNYLEHFATLEKDAEQNSLIKDALDCLTLINFSEPSQSDNQAVKVVEQPKVYAKTSPEDKISLLGISSVHLFAPSLEEQLLDAASRDGNLEKVKKLLELKPNVNYENRCFHTTALSYAASWGHSAIVEILLDHGADVDHVSHEGDIPLIKAARSGHLKTVEILLARGANVNHINKFSETARFSANLKGHAEIVKAIDEHIEQQRSMNRLNNFK